MTSLSGYETTGSLKKGSLITDELPDEVWWCIIKLFLIYSKNYIYYFEQPNSWHKYSTFICPFEFGKCEKEEKKLQKLEYISWEWKELFRWNKSLPFGVKIKNNGDNLET